MKDAEMAAAAGFNPRIVESVRAGGGREAVRAASALRLGA